MSKDKAEQNLIDDVQEALEKTKEALKTNDKNQIQTAKDNLLQVSHKLSEVLYQNVQGSNEEVIDPNVVDAEVVD